MHNLLRGVAVAAAAVLVAVVGALVVSPSSAAAGPILDQAGEALRRTPVYVHPDAERRISEVEAARVRDAIRGGDTPVFVAVLPAAVVGEVGTDTNAVNKVPGALAEVTGLSGTYAVVAGSSFRAGSSALSSGVAGRIATAAFQRRGAEGTTAVLLEFVEQVQRAAATADAGGRQPAAGDQGREPARSSGGGGSGWLLVLLFFAGALGLIFVMSRRSSLRRRRTVGDGSDGYSDGYVPGAFGSARFDPDRARLDLRPDLQMLGDDVLALEPEVSLNDAARMEYDAGVSRYRWAEAAIAALDSPDDVPRIRRALAEGNYAMARARAIARGTPPPPPPAELVHKGPNEEPAVEIDDDGRPAYAGYRNRGGGWFGGGYFGGNDLFTGLLLGQMLGGMFGGWGGGGGFERGYHEGQADSERSRGSDAGWAGGDPAGGDWGADGFGDFGGGGDVGGGDW